MTTPTPRMSDDRIETVIEEIATTSRSFAGDDKGLAVIRVTYVRPNGDRCFVDYPVKEEEQL